ncbi:MAG: tRNA lysidine(34) synthetase TilS [bacterium]
MSDLAARFLAGLGTAFQVDGGRLGLAVSGGGDSLALLHLAEKQGIQICVATVDHGLRAEAAAEAAEVGRICARLGVPHEVLRWQWDGAGNLQDAARRGRRGLIADWARRSGVDAVALGHTQNDVAETFLMRLARRAGVDGLSAMAATWTEGGVVWLRPLLAVSRPELRAYLRGRGVVWVDDPSNDDPRFDRVKARMSLAALQSMGITGDGLAEVAGHLAVARDALERVTDTAAQRLLQVMGNAVLIDPGLAAESAEVQRRLILRVIGHVAPAEYGPRGVAVQDLLSRLLAGGSGMLSGCRFLTSKTGLWAFREGKAVAAKISPAEGVWDGRWQITGLLPDGAEIRVLGAGIAQCTDWRATGLPRQALMTSPALWRGEALLAAPFAGFGPGYSAISLFPAAALHHSALSH